MGFAKLQGEGVEVYAKKTEIIIGRQSKSTNLDVVLGDNMNVSRQHAKIAYNPARGDYAICMLAQCSNMRVSSCGPPACSRVQSLSDTLQVCGSCTCWARTG